MSSICLNAYAIQLPHLEISITNKEKIIVLLIIVIIKAAYVNRRYDPYFVATKEDIEPLMPKVRM